MSFIIRACAQKFFISSKLTDIDYSESVKEWANIYESKSFIRGDISKLGEILEKEEKFNMLIERNIPLNPEEYGVCPDSYVNFPFGHKKPLTGYRYKPVDEDDEWLSIFKNLKNYLYKDSLFF